MKVGYSLGVGGADRAGSSGADALLPANLTAPGLSGTPNVGQTLTAVPGIWNGAEMVVGQWRRDGADIPGETGSVYLLAAEDDLAQISYHETATNAAGAAVAASPPVLALYEAPVVTGGSPDEIFDQHTGPQLIDASIEFTGGGLTFSATGTGVVIDPATGVLSVDTADPINGETVTVVAENSGGSAQKQFVLTVEGEDAADQVLAFSGSDGLVQPIANFSGGALDTDGFWLAGYAFFDGSNWDYDTLVSLGSSTIGYKQVAVRTNGGYARGDAGVGTDDLGTPSAPGWKLCVMHLALTTSNRADLRYWRNGEYVETLSISFKTDLTAFNQIGIGHRASISLQDTLKVPACGFAWGYGDPAGMQAWAYNGGALRDLQDYDFAGDADAALEGYWAGNRVGDQSAFDPQDILDEAGPLSNWAELGSVEWTDRSPPWLAGGIASIQSVTIEDAARNQAVVVVSNSLGDFLPSPDIAFTEADFDIWTERGFGPIRVQSAQAVLVGDQATVTLTLNRDIHASEAIRYQTSSGWYSDGGTNGASQAGLATNNSALADPATMTGLSFGKVAVEFAAPHVAGFYQDGLGYVVDDGSGVQITDTYPSPAMAQDERISSTILRDIHGAQVNPRRDTYNHGYDGRSRHGTLDIRYQDGLNIAKALPASLATHDSFIKVRSNILNASENGGDSYHSVFIEEAWGLHVTSFAPGANDFCPPLVGYDGTTARPVMSFDVSAVASSLPSYSTNGQARPPIAEVAARVARFNPTAGQIGSVEDRRVMTPSGITDEDGYGLPYAATFSAAGLCLIGDDTAAAKEDVVRGLASSGWQWYNALTAEGASIGPDGGQNSYHPFPMILALAWNGESAATIGAVATSIPANLFGQPVKFDAALVAAVMNPHGTAGEPLPKSSNDDLPYASHRKLVSDVAGNVVTMATAREAEIGGSGNTNPKIGHVGMRMRRESDGLTALITAENATARTYTLDNAAGFAASDTVYVIPAYDAAVGDYDWTLLGAPHNANSFGPNTSYRSLNKWSGMVMAVRAMGYMHANFDAWEGYVARANEADNPTASSDYPSHHSVYRRGPNEPKSPLFYNWDRDFWNAHWAAISTVPSTI